ncbi:MAG: TonB-dependent receptor [Saprospiraceae bacterium]
MTNIFSKLTLFFIFSLLYTSSQAQIDTTHTIDQVTITQNRIQLGYAEQNRQVQIITKEQIRSAPVTTLPELLQFVTGVDIRRRGPSGVQADIAIRGGGFEQTLVLLNGIRMNDAQTGHHNMYMPIDIQQIEKIEIIKGGASRLFGQNAFAGAINIITKPKNQTSLAGDIQYGSFNTLFTGITAELPADGSNHSMAFSYQSSDGYRYNTDYTILNSFYQSTTRIKGQDIKWMGGFTERKFGANGFYASPDFKDQYEEVQTSIVAATTNIILNEKTAIVPKLSWRRNQDMYLFVRNNPALYRNMHIGNNVMGEVHINHQNNLGTLGLGVDISRQALRSNNLGGHVREVFGLFAEQHMLLWSQKLSLTAGLYTQYVGDNVKKVQWYPGIDIGYAISDRMKVFGNVGYNNRLPTYTDLYYTSPSEQGNPNLTSESSWDAQIGLAYKHQVVSFGFTAFSRQSDNTIDWGKDSLKQTKWVVNNLTGLVTTGIETYATAKLNTHLDLNVQYTWLDARLDAGGNTVSRYILDNLRHQWSAGLTSRWLDNKLIASAFARYNQRNTPANLAALEGFSDFTLLDAKVEYRLSRLSIGLHINNITDEVYRETSLVPMPGTWVNATMRYQWRK